MSASPDKVRRRRYKKPSLVHGSYVHPGLRDFVLVASGPCLTLPLGISAWIRRRFCSRS